MIRVLLVLISALLLLASTPAVFAQSSTPALDTLGYPTLAVTSDGATLSAPATLPAGRYLVSYDGAASGASTQVSIVGPAPGQTADQLLADVQAMDLSMGPPAWYRSVMTLGGGVSGQSSLVELPPGEWVVMGLFFGNASSWALGQKLTVTGAAPAPEPIEAAIPVQFSDGALTAPEAIPAGPQIWAVSNTGTETHGLSLVMTSGPIAADDAIAALQGALTGMAMPGDGSASDTWTWTDIGPSVLISPGVTTWLEFDLQPGTYLVFCYQQDANGPHALANEVAVFTVG